MTYLNIYNSIPYRMNSMTIVEFYGRFLRTLIGSSSSDGLITHKHQVLVTLECMLSTDFEFL
ncbi:hypothetical protein BH18THE2_BH18THE2_03080 [soil metagenome]